MKNRLQELRIDRGWSQKELAEISNVAKTTISSIESGKSVNPSVDIAFKLSQALNVHIEEIFYALDEY